MSISDCITEQHLVESNRRKQEEQLRTELRTKKEEEEVPIEVNISDIQGPLRSIMANRTWLVADIKKVLERTEKIHRGRQRLLLGDRDVDDLQSLVDLVLVGPLNLVFVVCMDAHLNHKSRFMFFDVF